MEIFNQASKHDLSQIPGMAHKKILSNELAVDYRERRQQLQRCGAS